METPVPAVEIPKRALFKSSEVCEIAGVQPYVLRSWESEFVDLGVAKSAGGARVYRRADVERVLRIKQLMFSDGLTLAGVRRRIDEEAPTVLKETPATPIEELLGRDARERLAEIKRGLLEVRDLLAARPSEAAATHVRRIVREAAPAKRKNGARSARPAIKASRKRSSRR